MAVRHGPDDDLGGTALGRRRHPRVRVERLRACRTSRLRRLDAGKTAPRRRSVVRRPPRRARAPPDARACSTIACRACAGRCAARCSSRDTSTSRSSRSACRRRRRAPREPCGGRSKGVGTIERSGKRARARFTIHSPMRCGISGDGTIASRAKRGGSAGCAAEIVGEELAPLGNDDIDVDVGALGGLARVAARPRSSASRSTTTIRFAVSAPALIARPSWRT